MENNTLPLNALQPVLIAAPYQHHGGRQRELVSEEFDAETVSVANEKAERVAPVSEPEVVESRQQRAGQSQQPFLPGRMLEPSPRTMPGPQILSALIEQMGGAGVNPGPGQLIRVSA